MNENHDEAGRFATSPGGAHDVMDAHTKVAALHQHIPKALAASPEKYPRMIVELHSGDTLNYHPDYRGGNTRGARRGSERGIAVRHLPAGAPSSKRISKDAARALMLKHGIRSTHP